MSKNQGVRKGRRIGTDQINDVKKISVRTSNNHLLSLAVEMATVFNYVLLPVSCCGYRRRGQLKDFSLYVPGDVFYLVRPENITPFEYENLINYANRVKDAV